MNNTLQGINSRITKAEEWINDSRQKGGNHCCKTEYRKKNENKQTNKQNKTKKRRQPKRSLEQH